MTYSPDKHPRHFFLSLFFLLSVTILVLFWLLLNGYAKISEQRRLSSFSLQQLGNVRLKAEIVEKELHNLISDIDLIYAMLDMKGGFEDRHKSGMDDIGKLFLALVRNSPYYDQVRIIGADGREMMRVNATAEGAVQVPGDQLQDKESRYYFRDGMALARNEIYISTLDLNYEQGIVELPLKPMIRVVRALFDRYGRKRGIAVINYRAEHILKLFHSIVAEPYPHQTLLLNKNGRYLNWAHDEAGWETWLLSNEKRQAATDFPGAWERMKTQDEGVFRSAAGLTVFKNIDLNRQFTRYAGPSAQWPRIFLSDFWKIAVFVPRHSYEAVFWGRPAHRIAVFAGVVFSLVAAAGAAYIINLRVLQRREERLHAREVQDLFDRAPCGYHSIDKHGKIVGMNRVELDWLGYAYDEVVNRKTIFELLDDESGDYLRRNLERIAATGGARNLELKYKRRDGSVFDGLVNSSPVFDARGDFVKTRSSVFDITVRKQLKKRLEERERDFVELIEDVRLGTWQWNLASGRYLVNRHLRGMLGLDEDVPALDLSSWRERFHPQDLEKYDQALADLFAEKQAFFALDCRMRHRDGHWVWIYTLGRVKRRDNDGKPLLVSGIHEDISEHKSIEQKAAYLQKMEGIGRLAAGVAHEINTPLQAIQSNLFFLQDAYAELFSFVDEALRRGGDEAPAEAAAQRSEMRDLAAGKDLDFIRDEVPLGIDDSLQEVARVVAIVSALKGFSEVGEKRVSVIDPKTLAQNAVLVSQSEWKDVAAVEVVAAEALPRFRGDASLRGQALMNMIINSIQAIRDCDPAAQPGRIEINLKEDDGALIISVADTGAGIAEADREHIFEPFFTTREVGVGSGQGLSMVYDLVVNEHNGEIVCDSRPGEGTTFTLRLPLTPAPAD